MLEFLYTFQAQREKEIEPKMERFLNSLEDFAFYRQLPNHVKSSIEQEKIDLEKLIDSILNSPGLNLGQLPRQLLLPFLASLTLGCIRGVTRGVGRQSRQLLLELREQTHLLHFERVNFALHFRDVRARLGGRCSR